MKHNVKRLCSLLLALVLALSLLPTLSVPVSALYLEDTSLQCTWTLQDNMPLSDGTTGLKLTIRPTNGDSGRMDYYAYLAQNWVSTAPWAFYILQIEEVELTEGVLNAGGNLMSYFRHENTKLKKIIFADSVQEIGWNAFYRDHADETPLEVDWGSGIKIVESAAFTRSGVTRVCLPAIRKVENAAFRQCSKLESVYMASASGGMEMGERIFESCANLKEVTLVGSVPGISAYTFSGCEKLQSIMLPVSLDHVDNYAFNNCTSLSAVFYAGTPQQWAQISIAEGNECLQNATVIYNSKPYTITFDPNGGYVSPESMVTAASGKLPSLPTPTRSGYSFVGWFTEPEGGSSVSTNTVFNGDTTIYAHWFRYMDSTCAVTVNPPMADYHPATTAKSADTARYKATAVYFCPLNGGTEGPQMTAADSFVLDQSYRVHVRLTPVGEWAFSDETPATINGLVAESEGVSMGGDAWYYVDLTATEAPVCAATVSRPMPGQHPVSTGESGDLNLFTVSVVQYFPIKSDGSLGAALKETDVFTPNQVYRVVLVLWPVGGWEFSKDTKVTVNGIEATCLLAISGNGRGMYCADLSCENPFEDVTEADYFFNPVMWALGHLPQVTAGVDAAHFGPNNDCTREQIVTFLWAANGKPDPEGTGSGFSDVAPGAWYYKPVMWAVENKVTSGFSDGSFGVGQPCTRAQAMTFLWAAQGKPAPSSMESPFGDVSSGDWFCKAILWAYENGITKGVGNGLFGVNNTCTRAQIITFLNKAYQ